MEKIVESIPKSFMSLEQAIQWRFEYIFFISKFNFYSKNFIKVLDQTQ